MTSISQEELLLELKPSQKARCFIEAALREKFISEAVIGESHVCVGPYSASLSVRGEWVLYAMHEGEEEPRSMILGDDLTSDQVAAHVVENAIHDVLVTANNYD